MRQSAYQRSTAACLLLSCGILAATAQAPSPNIAAKVSAKDTRAADNAYIAGARALADNHPDAAERSFARAVELDPTHPEYALALTVARQHRVSALVQQAAQQRANGHTEAADTLLATARTLDPQNGIVTQHAFDLTPDALAAVADAPQVFHPHRRFDDLAGAPALAPSTARHSFHSRGDTQSLLREVFTAYGIKPTFDSSVTGQPARFDLEDADFATATRVLMRMAHVFSVPLTSTTVLLAKETTENREKFVPMIEETVFLPAVPPDQLTELSSIAKNVFDLKQVSINASAGEIVLRGPQDALQLVNATYADMLDGGAEVLLEVKVFEIDRTHQRDIGATLPSSIGVTSIATEAQNIVNGNQSLLNQLLASGIIPQGSSIYVEAFALLAAGATDSALSGILGTFGKFNGIPLAGVYLASGSTFNLLLNSSDARMVDQMTLRVSDRQLGTVRAGTRYPITTATYTSGISSALASQLSGVKINGTSASSLLSQYLGSAQSTVPQVQFEDLGLTLKATPQVQKSGQVFVHLDLKIEALGGGQINNIPILNSRQLTSDVTIPEGQTAMLASQLSTAESHAMTGIPGLNEIPGFSGTDGNVEKDTQELLITITPHLVRRRSSIITSRRLSANLAPQPD
jgi:type II secretory pathway component GspD/PulD (secretin)